MGCFETTPLCGRESLGEAEGREVIEGLADGGEPLFEGDGEGTEDRVASLRRSYSADRIVKESAALRLAVGHFVSRDQGEGFLIGESVAFDRCQQDPLVFRRQSAQRVGQREGDLPRIDPSGHGAIESLAQEQPLGDPVLVAPQQLADGGDGQVILVPEGGHHARLVHGAQRARRRVGDEQGGLPLGPRSRVLQDHGNGIDAGGTPLDEPLEAVDHLEQAIRHGHDPDR